MSDRYTRKDVEAQFERFVKAIGGKVAESYNDDGAYLLDHNSTYGGYNIMRLVGTHGGQTHVCGAMRRGPAAMMETLSFAIDAIEERDRNITICPTCGFRYRTRNWDGCPQVHRHAAIKAAS